MCSFLARQPTSFLAGHPTKMRSTIIAVLALTSAVLGGKDTRIIEGTDVNIVDYPWQGSYRPASGSHSCGCVFIGGNWVLTAAHCGGAVGYTMEFGTTDRNGADGTIAVFESIVVHPGFEDGDGFLNNDLAVVAAEADITGINVSPATISNNPDNPGDQPQGMITGWGRTCGGCAIPVTLQGTGVTIRTDEQCEAEFGSNYNRDTMVCMAGNGESGACNGDSGGPMTVGSTLYGITSWIYTGCPVGEPCTYVKVGYFHSWICGEVDNAEVEGC